MTLPCALCCAGTSSQAPGQQRAPHPQPGPVQQAQNTPGPASFPQQAQTPFTTRSVLRDAHNTPAPPPSALRPAPRLGKRTLDEITPADEDEDPQDARAQRQQWDGAGERSAKRVAVSSQGPQGGRPECWWRRPSDHVTPTAPQGTAPVQGQAPDRPPTTNTPVGRSGVGQSPLPARPAAASAFAQRPTAPAAQTGASGTPASALPTSHATGVRLQPRLPPAAALSLQRQAGRAPAQPSPARTTFGPRPTNTARYVPGRLVTSIRSSGHPKVCQGTHTICLPLLKPAYL